MNNTNILFCSEYVKKGNTLNSLNCFKARKLIISSRKNSKGLKSQYFLLSVLSTKEREYISSLYLVENDNDRHIYKFEYNRQIYVLVCYDTKAFIYTIDSYIANFKDN